MIVLCNVRDLETGRFLPGHKCLSYRDPFSGRFISANEFEYRRAVGEVDYFLENRRAM